MPWLFMFFVIFLLFYSIFLYNSYFYATPKSSVSVFSVSSVSICW